MSNEPTIAEMNHVIGVFDGRSFSGSHISDYTASDAPKMKYHSSWDQLMPCWKKAGVILYSIRRELDGEKYLEAYRITKCFLDACQKVDIERAHEAVYNAAKFIQWYNNQSTTTNE